MHILVTAVVCFKVSCCHVLQDGDGNAEVTQSNFMDLVENLLKNPEEREHYFQVSLVVVVLHVSRTSLV